MITNLEIFNEPLLTAIGWSIIHIFWQGTLIALGLALLLRFLRKKSASLRYFIALASLLLLIGCIAYNFNAYYQESSKKFNHYSEIKLNKEAKPQKESAREYGVSGHQSQSLITRIKQQLGPLDQYFPLIVKFWLIGVILFTVKLILSFIYTNHLKKNTLKIPDKSWHRRFKAIELKLNVKQTIRYFESQVAKSPMVVGYLKPVILIPVGMLTGIPENQINAIIAHEIAHIRRNDYIINIIQNLIEILLFFHPATWYISSQLRNERENSCDDIALTLCDNSLVYAKALATVQEFSVQKHYSAVAFTGKNKLMLNRIKRIIMKPKTKINFSDKIITALILLSAVFTISFTIKKPVPSGLIVENRVTLNEIKQDVSDRDDLYISPKIIHDTIKIKKSSREKIDIEENTIIKTYQKEGKKEEMRFTLKNGQVTELSINGEKIAADEYGKYQQEIDETKKDIIKAREDIRQAKKEIEEIDMEKFQFEVQEALEAIKPAELEREIRAAMEQAGSIDMEEIMRELEIHMEKLEDIPAQMERYYFDVEIDSLDIYEIRKEMEQVRKKIKEQIDGEAIQQELKLVQEELSKINREEIEKVLRETSQNFDEAKRKRTLEEMEEKLNQLEALELEEK